MLAVIDFGSNNTGSVLNALKALGIPNTLIKSGPELPVGIKGVILPGVGHFQAAMESLISKQLDIAIKGAVESEIPILGICLGMQLLAKTSDESWEEQAMVKGLGLVPAHVRDIKARCHNFRAPHMGWNDIAVADISIFKGQKEGDAYYFVHSHEVLPEDDPRLLTVRTNDEESIVAAYEYQNIIGLQFHPEKSQEPGLRLLKDFWVKLCCESE